MKKRSIFYNASMARITLTNKLYYLNHIRIRETKINIGPARNISNRLFDFLYTGRGDYIIEGDRAQALKIIDYQKMIPL
jgi:hypothetical protein